MKSYTHDIIIIGGGIVGLTLALALAKQTTLAIVVLESQSQIMPWSKAQYSHRVSAIALSSQRIFKALNVWDRIQSKRISPFTQIAVWDDQSKAELQFDCKEIGSPQLGFILENNLMQWALLEEITKYSNIKLINSVTLTSFYDACDHIILKTHEEELHRGKLVIAADGAHSWLRDQVGINIQKADYQQEALVATVKTKLPHDNIARQVFLNSGPLAFLPLEDANTSSIVWSLSKEAAARGRMLDEKMFQAELANAFSYRLGEVIETSKRFSFPLAKHQAETYIKPRIALVGDAAHMVHPLAGQGVNMGMLDAACLSEIIANAHAKQRDFSSLATLRRYERWRKADNFAMQTGIDVLKNIFESDKKTIQNFRSIGMNLTNQTNWFKKIFITHAVGNRFGLPKLALIQ